MTLLRTLAVSLLVVSPALAQTQLVRGDIDNISGTNRFVLDCTGIGLISSTVNLQALHDLSRQQDIEFEMRVTVAQANPTVLNVVSAVQIPEMFDMGNLRFGRSETWEVFGPSGSLAAVYAGTRASTRYSPHGAAGTWVIGPELALVRQGSIQNGRFQFSFQMPTIPALVGVEFTSQALVLTPSCQLVITNPDCREVRNN
jgi:hypothetical protein